MIISIILVALCLIMLVLSTVIAVFLDPIFSLGVFPGCIAVCVCVYMVDAPYMVLALTFSILALIDLYAIVKGICTLA